jgi:hypothetical protein
MGIAVVGMLLLLCAYRLTRDSETERQIQAELAKLRAAGHPTTAEELARLFPDPTPEENANILFGLVFPVAKKSRSRPENPFFTGRPDLPNRSETLTPEALLRLRAFVEVSRVITNHWPTSIPPHTRFAAHWERGIANGSFTDFVALRETVISLLAHALLAAENTNSAAASEALIKALQVISTFKHEGHIGDHMFRHGFENLIVQAMERCWNRLPFTASEMAALDQNIFDESPSAYVSSMKIDNTRGILAFQYIRDGGRFEDIVGDSNEPFWKRFLRRFQPGENYRPRYRDSDFLLFLRTIPDRQSVASAHPTNAPIRAREIGAYYQSNVVSEVGVAAGYLQFNPRLTTLHSEAKARMRVLKTALAVARHHAEKRTLPERLDDLVPEYLPAVPRDLFDDQPLRFKRLPRGYVVYSIGPDGVDDGGLERTNANATANYDVTFTVER